MPKTRTKAKEPKSAASQAASAFEGKAPDGSKVVGIGNLRVLICQEGDYWFSQGLEIDFAAQGKSLADVRKQFEDGLFATVHEHLRVFGTIKKLLKPAPKEVWIEFLSSAGTMLNRYTTVSVHPAQMALPFNGIDYIEVSKAA